MVTQQLPGTPIRELRSGITVLRYPPGSRFTVDALSGGAFAGADVVCLFGVGHDPTGKWWEPVLSAPIAPSGVRLLKVGTDGDIPLRRIPPPMYRQLDGVLCQTPQISLEAQAVGVPAQACFSIRNGIDMHGWHHELPARVDARRELDIHTQAFVVLGLGRFTVRKRFGDLIRAFDDFACGLSVSVQPELLLHGSDFGQEDGEETALRELAQLVSGRVRFVSPSVDARVSLAATDIMVTLSEREGAPNVFIEAFMTDRPVVASDLPGHRIYVQEQQQGLLVPVGDHAAAVAAIRQLHDDPAGREVMGASAAAAAMRFDIGITSHDYLRAFASARRRTGANR